MLDVSVNANNIGDVVKLNDETAEMVSFVTMVTTGKVAECYGVLKAVNPSESAVIALYPEINPKWRDTSTDDQAVYYDKGADRHLMVRVEDLLLKGDN